jgi:hypothetical protein
MKWLVLALGWLAVGVGWLVGIVGVLLTAMGFFAIIGLPLVAVAIGLVTLGTFVTSPAETRVMRLPARVRPLVLRVVGVRGGCPKGLQLGDTWRIQTGAMPNLCSPALTAVSSLLEQSPESGEATAACHCPLGDYAVTFAGKAA